MGYIGIVQHKEHSPEVFHIPPGTPCIFRDVRKLLFKRLFAFFLFRIRRHGVHITTILCRPGDIYHWWKWLSGETAAAEVATVVPGYWGHNYAAEREVWPELPGETV